MYMYKQAGAAKKPWQPLPPSSGHKQEERDLSGSPQKGNLEAAGIGGGQYERGGWDSAHTAQQSDGRGPTTPPDPGPFCTVTPDA